MPLTAVRLVLRAGLRGTEWNRTEALLEANLAEHLAHLDEFGVAGYAAIESKVMLIGGSDSPAVVATQLEALREIIPRATLTILDGLDHPAPETKPAQVASCIEPFFASPHPERSRDVSDATTTCSTTFDAARSSS